MNDSRYAIEVTVETRYLPDQSTPEQQQFAFAYTVTLRNRGDEGAQLLNRHWILTHGSGRVEEVQGEGVVGEQPYLAPGETYQYTSGAIMQAAVGTMRGHYEMQADDGHRFAAEIPEFTLAIPRTLH